MSPCLLSQATLSREPADDSPGLQASTEATPSSVKLGHGPGGIASGMSLPQLGHAEGPPMPPNIQQPRGTNNDKQKTG